MLPIIARLFYKSGAVDLIDFVRHTLHLKIQLVFEQNEWDDQEEQDVENMDQPKSKALFR